MLEQPQTGLIGRFYRQVENRPKKLSTKYYLPEMSLEIYFKPTFLNPLQRTPTMDSLKLS